MPAVGVKPDVEAGEFELRVRGDTKFTPVRVEGWSRGFSELRLTRAADKAESA